MSYKEPSELIMHWGLTKGQTNWGLTKGLLRSDEVLFPLGGNKWLEQGYKTLMTPLHLTTRVPAQVSV